MIIPKDKKDSGSEVKKSSLDEILSKKIEEVMAYNQSYIDKVGGLTEAFETLERGKKYLDKELLTKKQLKVLSDNLEAAKKFYNS